MEGRERKKGGKEKLKSRQEEVTGGRKGNRGATGRAGRAPPRRRPARPAPPPGRSRRARFPPAGERPPPAP
ncbi:hypothetical protein JL36_06025, partial [Lactococcus cremoris]